MINTILTYTDIAVAILSAMTVAWVLGLTVYAFLNDSLTWFLDLYYVQNRAVSKKLMVVSWILSIALLVLLVYNGHYYTLVVTLIALPIMGGLYLAGKLVHGLRSLRT